LKDWAGHKLAPVLADWYPKIVAMLPGPGFTATTQFNITSNPYAGVATPSRGMFLPVHLAGKEIKTANGRRARA